MKIVWSDINYFKESDFACKCGCGFNCISEELVFNLDEARSIAQIPFIVKSGCRCEVHNIAEGGEKDSSHKKGLAVDISCRSDERRFSIVSALLKVGFKRILIYDTFIHVDIDLDKPNPIIKIMK